MSLFASTAAALENPRQDRPLVAFRVRAISSTPSSGRARQSWSNGRVGTNGISYYAMTQWLVASLRPPSLKAMVPWEGAADMYRDFGYHGGIFSFGFATNWWNNHMAHHLLGSLKAPRPTHSPRPALGVHAQQPRREWWRGRQAVWENIDVPLYSAGNWSGMGLHLRGNTEGYLRAASEHKEAAHSRRHATITRSLRGRPTDQLRFFDPLAQGH